MTSNFTARAIFTLLFAVMLLYVVLHVSHLDALSSCSLLKNIDANVQATPYQSDDRIYFLETSGKNSINYRQSCAIESAARQNPDRPVFLYIASKEVNYTSRSIQLLGEYENIVVKTLDLNVFFNKTPLEQWYHSQVWKKSPYSVAHLSDYIRILSVYQGGGQYFDLDFVVTKSLGKLRNYIVYEANNILCNCVFHFDKGHPVVAKMVEKLASAYNPASWAAHGPLMVTDIIYSSCNVSQGVAYGPKCGTGVRLLNSTDFFPRSYDWKLVFNNNTSDKLPEGFSDSYAIHMWNQLSSQQPVLIGSSQYYAILASQYCPLSFAAALHKF